MYAKKWVLLILLMGVAVVASASPKIESWETPEGAKVLYVNTPQIPLLDVKVVFDAGSARDGDKHGIAMLTHDVLNESAGGQTAQQLAERFDAVGAQFTGEVNQEMATYSVRMLTDKDSIDSAIGALNTIIAKPDFTPDAVKRQKGWMLAGIQQKRQLPADKADEALMHAVFGNHPYGHPVDGNEKSVSALTRDDVLAFHRRYFVAKNASVFLVGAIDRSAAADIAMRIMAGLPAGQAAAPLPMPVALTKPVSVAIPHPSSQTHIHFGQVGISRTDGDFWPLYVGNHILGGSGLVSRLSEDVREKRGLAYSVASYFAPMRGAGIFAMIAQTRNGQAQESQMVMRETLQRFVKEGPTKAELEAAKQNLTGGFPLRVDDNRSIIEYISMIGFYGLPLDYLDRWMDRVNSVTAEQIRTALQKRIQMDKLVTVMVGDSAEAPKTKVK